MRIVPTKTLTHAPSADQLPQAFPYTRLLEGHSLSLSIAFALLDLAIRHKSLPGLPSLRASLAAHPSLRAALATLLAGEHHKEWWA
jgi:hypothetical protein